MTPRELAEEAREALRRLPRRTPEEVWQRLLDSGLIKMVNGKVKVREGTIFGDGEKVVESPPRKTRKKGKKRKQ
jgi:hypothetical protein